VFAAAAGRAPARHDAFASRVPAATPPSWRVNTVRFQGQDGQVRPARWVFEPRAGALRLIDDRMRSLPGDFLADALRWRVAAGPAQFDMVLRFPAAADDLDNPTVAWPDDRPRAVVGRLQVAVLSPPARAAPATRRSSRSSTRRQAWG
jgi:catalase